MMFFGGQIEGLWAAWPLFAYLHFELRKRLIFLVALGDQIKHGQSEFSGI